MSANINTVILAGNLTRDPELRALPNQSVVSFGLAINRKWTDKNGEKKEEVTFVDIEAWGKTAELVDKYCTKGKNILVEGRLKLDTWEDKDTKKKQSRLKVVADRVHFLDAKGSGDDASSSHGNADHRAVAPARNTTAESSQASANIDEPPF